MEQIHEILTLDLHEDIKNVIDLEDGTETEIQQEIESYIVTEGIGKHLDRFTGIYTSNIKETGVWLSGFYGSGKSYFGKMLGYLLANPTINGTPFRERFIPRLQGISDAVLLENGLLKLDSISGLVVFLDVAKQNTENGLAFTLFVNLLKRLGLRDDIYGYIEFDLLLDGKLGAFKDKVKASEGEDWETLKRSNLKVARTMRRTFLEMGYSAEEYKEIHETFTAAIQNFSSSKFKGELQRYFNYKPDERLVFIFDEASEAISQKKFTLLDLEGLSESLSSLSSRVWTIAIAQEKLDDVINNANVNRNQLTKVTDRFKTKIHLESTEVDVIIRSRLLQKKAKAHEALEAFYQGNDGMVADATNLKSSFPTKTTTATEFADYYPFHRYQFDILQRFLFSSNALVATQVAARGMIITTFDVLRKQMRECQLHAFTPGYAICTEAQTAPPVGLVSKYETARKILREQNSPLDGDELLKTVHLLSDSEVVSATVENITKSHISDISTYYLVKPEVESALTILVEAKVLLVSNHLYKITSDLEGKLLEDMKDFDVELFSKKRSLINSIKDQKLFASVSTYNDGTEAYKFSVLSDQDDELSGAGSKQLRIVVYSLFNIGDNRADFIEKVKLDTQHDKERITLVPQDGDFALIDKLIGEISRYLYIEEKYANDADPDKRKIIRDFASIREEKEKDLRRKIEDAYWHGTLIYLFDEYPLDPDKARVTIGENQKKLVRNVYTKRLPNQLSESLIPKLFSCRKDQLSSLFSGDDFKFFDSHGNFVGDHLKVVEEVTAKIKTRYVDGKSLEADLSGAPWGYRFGTIVTTLAVLLRAGRLSLKHNGETWFSHEQKGAHDAFTNATRFKSASFKTVAVKLTAAQKNLAVQLLIDLEIETHTGRKVDYNTNDFDLADGVVAVAEHFVGVLGTLHETVERFDALFPKVVAQKQALQGFGGKATEGNYIEKVEFLLANADAFREAVQTILQAQKFIKKQFPKVRQFKAFIDAVEAELRKADRKDPDIARANAQFNELFQKDMVGNYAALQQQVQTVKDSYFKLLKNAASGMTHQYQLFAGKVTAARQDLSQNYPADLNGTSLRGLETLERYTKERIVPEPDIEYATTCRHCGYSLSDMLNYTALVPSKETDLHLLQSSFVKVAPTPAPAGGGGGDPDPDPQLPPKPRRIQLRLQSRRMTVKEYKTILTAQITALASANPEDSLEIDVEVD